MSSNVIHLSDDSLLRRTRELALKERATTVELLEHLREVDSRKLWAESGFTSLFEYVRRELGYGEGAAYRRIEAMRVLRELPEIGEKIESGSVSLSSLASFRVFVKKEKLSLNEKRELLAKTVEGKSRRETEQLLGDLRPEALPKEHERVLSSLCTQITFSADRELTEKLEELRNLLAHRNPDPSYLELFHLLADLALKKLRPGAPKAAAPAIPIAADNPSESAQVATPPAEKQCVTPAHEETERPETRVVVGPRKKIAAELKRQVWARDRGQCTVVGCGSRYMLEIDHVIPVAYGGANTIENLRLLCRAHNQWHARAWGLERVRGVERPPRRAQSAG